MEVDKMKRKSEPSRISSVLCPHCGKEKRGVAYWALLASQLRGHLAA